MDFIGGKRNSRLPKFAYRKLAKNGVCTALLGNAFSSSIFTKRQRRCISQFCLRAGSAPVLSVILAAVAARAYGNHCVSTAMCRFIPDIFLPVAYPFPCALSVFLTLL